MKRKVHLYGALKKYGPVIEMNIAAPIDAFRAMFANYPETRKIVADGAFKIVVGDKKRGRALGEDELGFQGSKDLHIIPVAKGRGGGRGGGKIIAGMAIIALAVVTSGAAAGMMAADFGMAGMAETFSAAMAQTAFAGISYGTIASVGFSMVLAGAFQALSPTPKAADYAQRESPDQRSSFLYNGPVNTVEQGATIPLVYGRMRTGAVLVSAGISVEQI